MIGPVRGASYQPKKEFVRGEPATLVIVGYGSQKITLEMEHNGRVVSRSDKVLPAARNYQRDAGVQVQEEFGQLTPMRITEYFRSDQATCTYDRLPIGFYRITMLVNGAPVESVQFSVLGDAK